MMKKNFNLEQIKKNYLKNFISSQAFLNLQTSVIFRVDFNKFYLYDDNSINIVFKTTIKCGISTEKLKYPFVHVFVNNKALFSINAIEFEVLNYLSFLELCVKHTFNDFVDSFLKINKQQITMEDFGL